MRRTLRIYRTTWTRFGNCPDSPLRVLPLSDSGQRCRPASFFPFPARPCLPLLRLSKGRKPRLFLHRRDNSVRETNAQPAPATGLIKGFGVRPQRAETAISGIAGNRSFEPLWEQRHCLPSSTPPSNVPTHIKMAKVGLAIQLYFCQRSHNYCK